MKNETQKIVDTDRRNSIKTNQLVQFLVFEKIVISFFYSKKLLVKHLVFALINSGITPLNISKYRIQIFFNNLSHGWMEFLFNQLVQLFVFEKNPDFYLLLFQIPTKTKKPFSIYF